MAPNEIGGSRRPLAAATKFDVGITLVIDGITSSVDSSTPSRASAHRERPNSAGKRSKVAREYGLRFAIRRRKTP
jgi:hypothetical protein